MSFAELQEHAREEVKMHWLLSKKSKKPKKVCFHKRRVYFVRGMDSDSLKIGGNCQSIYDHGTQDARGCLFYSHRENMLSVTVRET